MLDALIRSCVRNPVIVLLLTLGVCAFGVWSLHETPVDAIPDISENQVIVDTRWPGRSPRDVEDQVTYPLVSDLQGVPGVREIRATSGFGFSRIYVVFEDGVEFYWARTRVLERLETAGEGLPGGVVPALGPDATPLGQVFWYYLEGPYDLGALRTLQDFTIRYALQSVEGVAEVASVGGFVQEYQIDVRPEALRAYDVGLDDVVRAVRRANVDVGAKTIEHTGMESVIRGVGFAKGIEDLREVVVKEVGNVAVTLRQLAHVTTGPAFRRGALADDKSERVGGVVAMRFGENPRAVIRRVKGKIDELSKGLPEGVRIVAFYDRTQLVDETVETLGEALGQELLITVVIILLFLLHVRTSLIVAATLPLSVLLAFIGMRFVGVDSNIMSLAGIAIAIGTMVDMGIVMAENVFGRVLESSDGDDRNEVVEGAATEVGGAILTAILTTVVSFIPVFFLTDQEGKLFRPLAWTKTFSMLAAVLVALTLVPVLCRLLLKKQSSGGSVWLRLVGVLAVAVMVGLVMYDAVAAGMFRLGDLRPGFVGVVGFVGSAALLWVGSRETLKPIEQNPVSSMIAKGYAPTLRWVLGHKGLFLIVPTALVGLGLSIWIGGGAVLAPLRDVVGSKVDELRLTRAYSDAFPGVGRAFMPPLDEGSLLYMPSLLPQASLSQTLDAMLRQNRAMREVPEVAQVMGKLGRAESALDPAPIGMIETVVNLKPRDQWRSGVTKARIVEELRQLTHQPGVPPSWLQPIETRVVMLQSGIRSSIGLEIRGDDPAELERVAVQIEPWLREVEGAADVTALRLGTKPYLEMHLDRRRMAVHGVNVQDVQDVIEVAIGGKPQTVSVEGRERYPVRIRYPRERRDRPDRLKRILVPTRNGAHVPLSEVAEVRSVTGPASLRSIDGKLVGYVMLNAEGRDEVSVVEDAQAVIDEKIANGDLVLPKGSWLEWTGRFENQVRANERLSILIPVCLLVNLFLLYLNFRRISLTLVVFAAIPVAMAGGFVMIAIWPSIQDLLFEIGLLESASSGPVHLTVAVWVGFIALFGIAVDDGVVMATYIGQVFERARPETREGVRAAVLEAGLRRIRPCLMTTATTVVALLPVLLSTGRGADVMRPMALPVFGGMLVELVTLFVVPCLVCLIEEWRIAVGARRKARALPSG